MFDIAPSELLVVAIVALLVIGPKDLPLALRTAGKWIGKVRRMSNHFRSGVETMIREAELAEIEKEWRERNARIMAEHPDAEGINAGADEGAAAGTDTSAEPLMEPTAPASAEAGETGRAPVAPEVTETRGEPELPLGPAARKRS